jgi:hypothetical protein
MLKVLSYFLWCYTFCFDRESFTSTVCANFDVLVSGLVEVSASIEGDIGRLKLKVNRHQEERESPPPRENSLHCR